MCGEFFFSNKSLDIPSFISTLLRLKITVPNFFVYSLLNRSFLGSQLTALNFVGRKFPRKKFVRLSFVPRANISRNKVDPELLGKDRVKCKSIFLTHFPPTKTAAFPTRRYPSYNYCVGIDLQALGYFMFEIGQIHAGEEYFENLLMLA